VDQGKLGETNSTQLGDEKLAALTDKDDTWLQERIRESLSGFLGRI
jgi:hypothetical protein